MKYALIYTSELFETLEEGRDPYLELLDFNELKQKCQKEMAEYGKPNFVECRSLSELNDLIATVYPEAIAVEAD